MWLGSCASLSAIPIASISDWPKSSSTNASAPDVRFDSLVKVAAPPIGTQLARPDHENIATHYFNPFHRSHLPDLEWPPVPGVLR